MPSVLCMSDGLMGVHCTLYPLLPHTIHPPHTEFVLRESVNCILEVLDIQGTVFTKGTFEACNVPEVFT